MRLRQGADRAGDTRRRSRASFQPRLARRGVPSARQKARCQLDQALDLGSARVSRGNVSLTLPIPSWTLPCRTTGAPRHQGHRAFPRRLRREARGTSGPVPLATIRTVRSRNLRKLRHRGRRFMTRENGDISVACWFFRLGRLARARRDDFRADPSPSYAAHDRNSSAATP